MIPWLGLIVDFSHFIEQEVVIIKPRRGSAGVGLTRVDGIK